MTKGARLERLRREAEAELAKHDHDRALSTSPLFGDQVSQIHALDVYRIELEMQNDELQCTQLELERLKNHYSDLYDFAPIGYFTLSETGRILEVNLAGAALLAINRSDLIGRLLTTFAIVQDVRTVRRHITEALNSGLRQTVEIAVTRADGMRLFVRLESLPSPVVGTAERHLRTAMIDITQNKQAADALQAAKNQAEQANAAKSRFLAAASHDLRQPLHAIALLHGILATKVKGDATMVLAQCGQAVDAMMEMLDALLNLNQLETGAIRPHATGFPIAGLLAHLTSQFATDMHARNLQWRMVPSRLHVVSDPHLLEQILRNLLSNAANYTHRGKVLLGCRRHQDTVLIQVWDTGIGIPENQIQAIFEEFSQLNNPARQSSQGYGLGLAIVKRLASQLGHTVHVRSRLGKGSVFTVVVPLSRDQAPLLQS